MLDFIVRMMQDVLCWLNNSTILTVVELLGNLCVILITFYTFFLGFFSKRVTIQATSQQYNSKGNSFALTLKNHSMRTFFIKGIELIVDKKYLVKIMNKDSTPVELSSLGVAIIQMEPYSDLSDDFKIPMLYEKRMCVRIELADRYIFAKPPLRIFRKRGKYYQPITVLRKTYNDIIIQNGDKYALHYFEKPSDLKEHIIIIHESGHMSDSMSQYDTTTNKLEAFNAIPCETANSYEKTVKLFESVCEPLNIKFYITELDSDNALRRGLDEKSTD